MKILAVEASGPVGSVCTCEDEEVLAELRFGAAQEGSGASAGWRAGAQTHARELLPCVDALLRRVGWQPRGQIELVSVSQGPGSYTGLRVAIAFAKTFAYAADCALVGVPSLDVLAQNALAPTADLAAEPPVAVGVVVDAKRGQVYAGLYRRSAAGLEREEEPAVLAPDDVLRRLKRLLRAGERALLLGDGLAAYAEQLRGDGLIAAPRELWIARAPVVARLGLVAFRSGRRASPWQLLPLYMRPPEAEEKRLEREAAGSDHA